MGVSGIGMRLVAISISYKCMKVELIGYAAVKFELEYIR